MTEKSCRCGASKKRFKVDIGPFYIAECCEEAGFDNLGNRKETPAVVEVAKPIGDQPVKVEISEPKKVSKSMKSMTLEELKALADEKGVQGTESMSRKKLMAALKQ
mgnify:CR=1 FL=1